MIIQINPALPCAQYEKKSMNAGERRKCGQMTTHAVVTPAEGDVWEMLPVCPRHLKEVADDLALDSSAVTPADIRTYWSN